MNYDYRKDILLRSRTLLRFGGMMNEYTQLNQKVVLFNKLNAHRVHAYYLRGQWDNAAETMQFQEFV